MDESRRRFLKASGAVVGTGVLGSTAGCTGILGGGGGGGGLSAYTDWMYEPGEVRDSDHYTVSLQSNAEIVANEDEFDDDTFDVLEESFESSYEFLDLDFDEVDDWLYFDGSLSQLLTGYQVDRADVEDELEDNDYEDEDEYEGFQVFLGPNESRAVGLTNSEIVVASSALTEEEAEDILETTVDTYNGEEDRYVDESDDFAAVTSQLNSGTFVGASTHEETEETNEANGQFEGAVAQGSSSSVNGETMDVQSVITFDDADDIDMGDVEDFRDDSGTFDDVDDVGLSSSGRSVIITGTIDTDDY